MTPVRPKTTKNKKRKELCMINITAAGRPGAPGVADIFLSGVDMAATPKLAVRYVTPVTPDNELGFKQVNAYNANVGGKPATHVAPGGFPSGVLINVYVQGQNSGGTQD